MEKLIHKFINQNVKNVDTYQHNGSIWLIFTEDKKWVIELTKEKTLWYNYNFFKSIFEFFSMDLVENQHYITKWVEDNIINKVNSTHRFGYGVEDDVEDTIQNGVKETKQKQKVFQFRVDGTIQNGVKETFETEFMPKLMIEDTIQNGVKETKTPGDGDLLSTMEWMEENEANNVPKLIDYVVKYGVKKTEHEMASREWKIGEVIKEVQPLPAQDGNRDWGKYYHNKEDRTKPFNEYVNDTIKFGVKETKHMDEWVNTENIIKKVIKDGKINTNTIS